MTRIASAAFTDEIWHLIVRIRHGGAIVLVADDAAEHGVVVRIGMTIAAAIPYIAVAAGINWEIQTVVIELSIPIESGVT